jgi:hypothetical protein
VLRVRPVVRVIGLSVWRLAGVEVGGDLYKSIYLPSIPCAAHTHTHITAYKWRRARRYGRAGELVNFGRSIFQRPSRPVSASSGITTAFKTSPRSFIHLCVRTVCIYIRINVGTRLRVFIGSSIPPSTISTPSDLPLRIVPLICGTEY